MGRVLLSLCGPFAIYSYGFFIAIATFLFIHFLSKDTRFQKLNLAPYFSSIFLVGIASILLGGRALHLLAVQDRSIEWIDWVSFWEPGFSALGSIVTFITVVSFYVHRCGIPVLPFADFVGTYAGILQGISRFGCFFAGCCYGCISASWWAVCYTDVDSAAPLHIPLHPTQIYSVVILLLIFIFMYCIGQKILLIPGQQATIYIMLSCAERFFVDFWRGDRDFLNEGTITFLSIHQCIALGLFILAGILFVWVSFFKNGQQNEYIQHY